MYQYEHLTVGLQKIMGDYPSKKTQAELTQNLIEIALTLGKDIWKDELYVHLMKQLTNNRSKFEFFFSFSFLFGGPVANSFE